MADLADDPEFQAWAQDVRMHILPQLRDSAMSLSLVPDPEHVDIKFAVELGMSIMLDKPIIAVVHPGSHVPERLIRVADEIVEADLDSPDKEKIQQAIIGAMNRVSGE